MLEPYAGKLARPVLRGGGCGNTTVLPDHQTRARRRYPRGNSRELRAEIDGDIDPTVLEIDHETRHLHFLGRADFRSDILAIFRQACMALAEARSDRDRLRVIAYKFQQLERLSPHRRGNSRVNILTLMTDLVEHGFQPALLANLREDAYLCTLEEMVSKIERGMQEHQLVTTPN